MTLDEAIKHAEEEAKEQDKLCKRYDDASGYSRSHNEAIRTTDAKRREECAKEHRQLADWLKDYKRLLGQEPKTGHWIGAEYDAYADGTPVYDTYECSECGWEMYGGENSLTNYCPSCGAEMDK